MNKDILFYAFRYALGRRTSAVECVVGELAAYWDELKPHTRKMIQREIRERREQFGKLGDDCDERDWNKILDLD